MKKAIYHNNVWDVFNDIPGRNPIDRPSNEGIFFFLLKIYEY
jgi:hypothetical protein